MTVRVSVWKQYRLHFISKFMASLLSLSLPKPSLLTTKATAATTTTTITTTTTTTTAPSPPDTLSLDQKFGRKGIKFSEPGGDAPPTVELTVRNGSSVKLQISNAHVTSYKPKVYWKDDGFEEILYTIPPSPTTNASKGGIGLVINNVTGDPKSRGSPVDISQWDVKDADSDSIDAVQVELNCITSGTLDITYVISLYPLCMATAVLVKNKGTKPVDLTSAMLSHFKFKKRSLTGISGLQGCSFCVMPPLSSPFEILSPAEAMKTEDLNWISSFGWDPEMKPGSWGVQDWPRTILRHKLSRVYGAPPEERLKEFYKTTPSKYETLDQGKELFFRVIRMGYDDIYLSSPGSMAGKYGKDYFICTGPASMVVPITVDPGEEWRGAQVIEHDNL